MLRFCTNIQLYYLMLGIVAGFATLSTSGAVLFESRPGYDDHLMKVDDIEKWGASKLVFTAALTKVVAGPVGRSFPPVYTHRLEFEILEVLRGADAGNGIAVGEILTCSNVARQHEEPTFPEGKKCLVAADLSRGSWQIVRIEKLTDDNIAAAKRALQVPFGWAIKNGDLVSPWASLGEKAWPKGQDMNVTLLCSVTGRPALMGGAAEFSVEPVPPKEEIKWTNPDGDGLYTVTVSNPTDQQIEIPALLSSQGEILWADSLVMLCQGKTYIVPGATGVSGKVEPTVLKPGEKVSTVINALTLKGPDWPKGGQRVGFQFCLGEKSNIQSFYYMSRHHDAIRKNAKPVVKAKDQKRKKQSGAPGNWADKIAIESKRNSTVDVSTSDRGFELAVQSPTGIDTLTISRKQTAWPDSITVRLHTKGLESIRISNAAGTISGEFPSTARRPPIIEFAVQGKGALPIDSTSPHWPDLSLVSPGKTIPVEQGYFKFKIPSTLLTPESETVTVAWIDFYRG